MSTELYLKLLWEKLTPSEKKKIEAAVASLKMIDKGSIASVYSFIRNP